MRTFIYDVKNMLGRSYDDEDISELRKSWSFTVSKGDECQCMIEVHDREAMEV